ncbi:MAG: PTS sugar transporter subunit IIB [Mycoplasmatales bacterium]
MKILVTCGNGCGSSLIVEMKIKSLLEKYNITAEVDHCDLATAKTTSADVYVGSLELIEQLDYKDKIMVGLINILDEEEITEKLINRIN